MLGKGFKILKIFLGLSIKVSTSKEKNTAFLNLSHTIKQLIIIIWMMLILNFTYLLHSKFSKNSPIILVIV